MIHCRQSCSSLGALTGCWISCHMSLSAAWPLAFPRVSSQPVPTMEAIVIYDLIFLTICSWSHRVTLLWGQGTAQGCEPGELDPLGACRLLTAERVLQNGIFLAANLTQ